MSAIKDAWARIGHWLKNNARSIKLRKGCSQSRLTKLEATLKIKLPEGFHESHLEHNGDNQIGCFPYSRFLLSLDGVGHEWQRMCELMRVDSDAGVA